MDAFLAGRALARACSTMTTGNDALGALSALLKSCRDTLGVDAAGILIQTGGTLELLGASSHEVSELEVYQSDLKEGPCIQSHTDACAVQAVGRGDLLTRWPTFGPKMLAAGFESAHASPLVWHGTAIGAMGLFSRSPQPFTTEEVILAQAFADIATMLIISSEQLAACALDGRLKRVLSSRATIEQAKGVLVQQHQISMAHAYDLLVQSAADRKVPLAWWASRLIENAYHPPRALPDWQQ